MESVRFYKYNVFFKEAFQGAYIANSAESAFRQAAKEYGSTMEEVTAKYGPYYSAVKLCSIKIV